MANINMEWQESGMFRRHCFLLSPSAIFKDKKLVGSYLNEQFLEVNVFDTSLPACKRHPRREFSPPSLSSGGKRKIFPLQQVHKVFPSLYTSYRNPLPTSWPPSFISLSPPLAKVFFGGMLARVRWQSCDGDAARETLQHNG